MDHGTTEFWMLGLVVGAVVYVVGSAHRVFRWACLVVAWLWAFWWLQDFAELDAFDRLVLLERGAVQILHVSAPATVPLLASVAAVLFPIRRLRVSAPPR